MYLSSTWKAEALLHALQLQPGRNFPSVRELRFFGELCGTDAFLILAVMCPNVQARFGRARIVPALNPATKDNVIQSPPLT